MRTSLRLVAVAATSVVAAVGLPLLTSGPAAAAEITVTTLDDEVSANDQTSLREAITTANGGGRGARAGLLGCAMLALVFTLGLPLVQRLPTAVVAGIVVMLAWTVVWLSVHGRQMTAAISQVGGWIPDMPRSRRRV